MEPTLNQVFGSKSSQSSEALNIAKEDLANTGLTAATTNTAESLVVAILRNAASYLNPGNQANNPDIQVTIEQLQESTVVKRNSNYCQEITYVIKLYKKFDLQIHPDDY